MSVRVVVGFDEPQKLDLVEGLVDEVLAVGDYFEAGKLLPFAEQIPYLYNLGKYSAAKDGNDLIPAHQYISIFEF